MYKLVGVAGKIRGQEFEIQDGENVLGRGDEATIKVEIKEVSKRHFAVTPSVDGLWLEDLGSANGTFVNGKLEKKYLLQAGDKVSIPDAIFEVVAVQEKKKIIKKYTTTTDGAEEDDITDYIKRPPVPTTMAGKVIWFFKYKIMPFAHSVNEDYEWRSMIGIFLAAFVIVVMTITIFPILLDAHQVLIEETTLRAEQYTSVISQLNAQALRDRNLDQIDTSFLDQGSSAGVERYELYDLEGRIFRPISRQNQYVDDPFSIRAREWAARQDNKGEWSFKEVLMSGEIGVAQKIMAYDVKTGSFEGVGVIAIHFMPKSLAVQASKNSLAYLKALATSIVIAVIFFGFFYYITLRPLQEMRFQIDEAMRGKRKNLESHYLMAELGP
ncbi:MAG: FHA domain-containing protein, partial [Bacteriovoracaceae bacterium]|nr:FHA domain-containing protein [Bacteriovoracaceae bacterium]